MVSNNHKTTLFGVLGGAFLYMSNIGKFPNTRSDWLSLIASAFIAGLSYYTNKRD